MNAVIIKKKNIKQKNKKLKDLKLIINNNRVLNNLLNIFIIINIFFDYNINNIIIKVVFFKTVINAVKLFNFYINIHFKCIIKKYKLL